MKRIKKSFILLLSLVMMLAFALPVSAAGINISSIKSLKVAKTSTTVFTNGEEQTITVNGTYAQGQTDVVALYSSSSNRAVAYVEAGEVKKNGGSFTADYKIKAVGNGKAVITIADKYNARRVARCTVIVKTYANGINLNNSCIKTEPTEEGTQYSITVAKGGKVNLGAVVSNSNASDKVLKYKSMNTTSVAVDARGNVTGKSVVTGGADVVITSRDGKATKTVKVYVVDNTATGKITFAKELTTTKQEAGKLNKANVLCLTSNVSSKTNNYQLVATNSSYKISDLIFVSNNDKIAKVSANGKITAVKTGVAKITATPKLGQKVSAVVTVKVTTDPEVINMTASKKTILANGRDIAKITAVPNSGVNAKLVKYAVYKNGAVTKDATIAGGNLKVRNGFPGEYTVKAYIGDVESNITITAIEPTTQFAINGDKIINIVRTSDEEFSKELTVTSNGKNNDVAWATSNAKVATVEDGKVVAVGNGTAKITAKALDGTNKVAAVTVKVTTNAYSIDSKAVSDENVEDGEYVLYVDGTTGKVAVNLAKKIAAFANASASNKVISYFVSERKVATAVVAEGTPVHVIAKTVSGKELKVVLKYIDRAKAAMKYKVEFDSTDDIDLIPGGTANVLATVTAEEADKTITSNVKNVVYKSTNAAVASVDATGKVVAKAPGKATISASFVNAEKTTFTTVKNIDVYVGVKDATIRAAVNGAFSSVIREENRDYTGLKTKFNAAKNNFEFQVLNPKQDLAKLEDTGLSGSAIKALLGLEVKGIKLVKIDVEDTNGNVYTIEREAAISNLYGEIKNIIESAIGENSVLEKWVGTSYVFTITTTDTKYGDREGLNHKISYDAFVTLTDARQKELVNVDIASALEGIEVDGLSKIEYNNDINKAVVYINKPDMTIDEFDANRTVFEENLSGSFANVSKVEYTLSVAGMNFAKTEVDEDGNKPIDVVNGLFDLYKEKLTSINVTDLAGADGAIAVAKVTFKLGTLEYARTYEVKAVIDESTFDETVDNAIISVVPTEDQHGTFEFDAKTNTAKVTINADWSSKTPIQLEKEYFDDINRQLVAAAKIDTDEETVIVLNNSTYVVSKEQYKESYIMDLLAKANIGKLSDLDGKIASIKVPVKVGATTTYVMYEIVFKAEKSVAPSSADDIDASDVEVVEEVIEDTDEVTEDTEEVVDEDTAEEVTDDEDATEEVVSDSEDVADIE